MYTFGKTLDGTTTLSSYGNYKAASRYTLADYAVVSKLTLRCLDQYLSYAADPGAIKGVIYASETGEPGALLGTTEELSMAGASDFAWRDLSFTTPVFLAPGDYYLGFIGDSNCPHFAVRVAETGSAFRTKADTYNDGPSDPWGTPSSSTAYSLAIYATYEEWYCAGAVTAAMPQLSGIATVKVTGTGAVTAAMPRLSGVAFRGAPGVVYGMGAVTAAMPQLEGAGDFYVPQEMPLDLRLTRARLVQHIGKPHTV